MLLDCNTKPNRFTFRLNATVQTIDYKKVIKISHLPSQLKVILTVSSVFWVSNLITSTLDPWCILYFQLATFIWMKSRLLHAMHSRLLAFNFIHLKITWHQISVFKCGNRNPTLFVQLILGTSAFNCDVIL